MVLEVSNQTCVVTGATSGIGHALARALRARGARVIAASRASHGLNVMAIAGWETLAFDLAEPETMRASLERSREILAGTRLLFHAGGTAAFLKPSEMTVAQYLHLFTVNTIASIVLLEAMRPHIRDAGGGTCVVIGSRAGTTAAHPEELSVYGATKQALGMYLDAQSTAWARDGIQLVFACPGGVNTKLATHALGGSALAEHMRRGALTEPEVVACQLLDDLLPQPTPLGASRWEGPPGGFA